MPSQSLLPHCVGKLLCLADRCSRAPSLRPLHPSQLTQLSFMCDTAVLTSVPTYAIQPAGQNRLQALNYIYPGEDPTLASSTQSTFAVHV
jgi:hypothetical protein